MLAMSVLGVWPDFGQIVVYPLLYTQSSGDTYKVWDML